jgi:hypothetical protein
MVNTSFTAWCSHSLTWRVIKWFGFCYMAYQVPARFVCWYIVQLDNKKLRDCPPSGVKPGHYGHTNCSRGIGPDGWTSGGHLEIPLSCHTYRTHIVPLVMSTNGLVIKELSNKSMDKLQLHERHLQNNAEGCCSWYCQHCAQGSQPRLVNMLVFLEHTVHEKPTSILCGHLGLGSVDPGGLYIYPEKKQTDNNK